MLYIFFRTCLNNKPNNLRPDYFSYERCFVNLCDTSFRNDCKLTIMFDGSPEQYNESFIKKYQDKYNFHIQFIKGGGDFQSNIETFKYIKELVNFGTIKNNDLIMVQENDYLFIPRWIDYVLSLYNATGYDSMHYTTLYDHGDKYLCAQNVEGQWGMYKDLQSKIFITSSRHWRFTPSTCASFIMSKKLFLEDYDVHISGDADNTRFGKLTSERKRVVVSPIPSLSTHCQVPWMAPIINWEEILNNTQLL